MMSKSITRTIIEIITLIKPEITCPINEDAFQAFQTNYNLTGALSMR